MRRLTLILSDLYLPEEGTGGEVPQTDELPQFSWLLRHAQSPVPIGDWRRWLVGEVGGPAMPLTQASLCAAGHEGGSELATAWIATPVALEARLDHVRMKGRGLLRLDAERAEWCAEFDRVFAPQYQLRDGGERAFILSGPDLPSVTADPARLLGAEIGPALPGADEPELRRLWAEIEMWLHGCALNDARERADKPRISAFWLWGRDLLPAGKLASKTPDLELLGGDPLIGGLARTLGLQMQAVPQSLSQIVAVRSHVVAEFAVVTGRAHETLAQLDSQWFAAARHALARGALSSLEIVANDRCFRVAPLARWRFWRPRRGWFENLARPAGKPQV